MVIEILALRTRISIQTSSSNRARPHREGRGAGHTIGGAPASKVKKLVLMKVSVREVAANIGRETAGYTEAIGNEDKSVAVDLSDVACA